MGRMHTDPEPQTIFARRPGPAANQILFRPDVDRVPRLIPAVPVVKVVMMVGQREEVLRPGAFVECHQLFGIPTLRLPFVNHVLETEPGGRAVMLDVKFVLVASLDIHEPRIPIAIFRLALRPTAKNICSSAYLLCSQIRAPSLEKPKSCCN